MLNKEIVDLFERFNENRCSPSEMQRVFNYIETGEFLNEWDFILREQSKETFNSRPEVPMNNHRKYELQSRIERTVRAKNKQRVWLQYSAAAILLITLSVSLVFNQYEKAISTESRLTGSQDITPGSDVATLTLEDGSVIVLDDTKGSFSLENISATINNSKGAISYLSSPSIKKPVVFHTLSTPRGGQYQLVLPDGTKAWLNAASSIIYPTDFIEDQRSVKVIGEVYFEVMPNKAQPFVVETAGQSIEVLGTRFNVNAYEDEGAIRTTLLEGKVKVILPSTKSSVLSPGQQSVVIPGMDHIALHQVDTDASTAWKDGDIYFDDTDLKGVLRQLARWYDVDIDLKGIPEKKLNGIISRNVNLSVVLEAIEQTSDVSLTIENTSDGKGRRISME